MNTLGEPSFYHPYPPRMDLILLESSHSLEPSSLLPNGSFHSSQAGVLTVLAFRFSYNDLTPFLTFPCSHHLLGPLEAHFIWASLVNDCSPSLPPLPQISLIHCEHKILLALLCLCLISFRAETEPQPLLVGLNKFQSNALFYLGRKEP